MQQFEYKTFPIPLKNALFSKKQDLDMESIEDELNLLGRMGWELTTQFTRQKNGFSQYALLILKRPIVPHSSKNKS